MDQREAFLGAASGGHGFTRRIIEQNVQQVESGQYKDIRQSAGWYSIRRNGNTIMTTARIRGDGIQEYSWEVPK